MRLKHNKKGFTVIEFAVIILVIGILLFIAKPNFTRNIQKTKLTHITYDIKIAENYVEELMIMDRMPVDWVDLASLNLKEESKNGNVYNLHGLATNIEDTKYQKLSKLSIKSKLKGDFYTDLDGRVYYVEVLK